MKGGKTSCRHRALRSALHSLGIVLLVPYASAGAELACSEGKNVGSGSCNPISVSYISADITAAYCGPDERSILCEVSCVCHWDVSADTECPAGSTPYHGGHYGSCLPPDPLPAPFITQVQVDLPEDAVPCDDPREEKARCKAFFSVERTGEPSHPEHFERACAVEDCARPQSTDYLCCTDPPPKVDTAAYSILSLFPFFLGEGY